MKYALIIITLLFTLSCKQKSSKTDFNINCIETTLEDSDYSDFTRIKTCGFYNHVFKSIGTPDNKGRYSYDYELFSINKDDSLKILNSDFFNKNTNELEKLINDKLKTEYESNSKIPEISDCMKWIDFRYYDLNEFGISFNYKNQMEFSIDYEIGSACFNVSSGYVAMDISELEGFLK